MNKKETEKSIIKKTIFLSIFLISQVLYLQHLFTDGLLAHYGYKILRLESIGHISILLLVISIVALCLIIILYGIIKEKKYFRKFTIIYLIWASIFPVWAMIVSSYFILSIIALLVNIIILIYLVINPFKTVYFETRNELLLKIKDHYKGIIARINRHLTKKHN